MTATERNGLPVATPTGRRHPDHPAGQNGSRRTDLHPASAAKDSGRRGFVSRPPARFPAPAHRVRRPAHPGSPAAAGWLPRDAGAPATGLAPALHRKVSIQPCPHCNPFLKCWTTYFQENAIQQIGGNNFVGKMKTAAHSVREGLAAWSACLTRRRDLKNVQGDETDRKSTSLN